MAAPARGAPSLHLRHGRSFADCWPGRCFGRSDDLAVPVSARPHEIDYVFPNLQHLYQPGLPGPGRFLIGILGGFFGVGGSFIAGPALRLMGMDWNYAVGTDLAHIVGKSIVAAR